MLIRVQAYVTSRLPAGSGLTVFFENGQMQSAEDGESIILSGWEDARRMGVGVMW